MKTLKCFSRITYFHFWNASTKDWNLRLNRKLRYGLDASVWRISFIERQVPLNEIIAFTIFWMIHNLHCIHNSFHTATNDFKSIHKTWDKRIISLTDFSIEFYALWEWNKCVHSSSSSSFLFFIGMELASFEVFPILQFQFFSLSFESGWLIQKHISCMMHCDKNKMMQKQWHSNDELIFYLFFFFQMCFFDSVKISNSTMWTMFQ